MEFARRFRLDATQVLADRLHSQAGQRHCAVQIRAVRGLPSLALVMPLPSAQGTGWDQL